MELVRDSRGQRSDQRPRTPGHWFPAVRKPAAQSLGDQPAEPLRTRATPPRGWWRLLFFLSANLILAKWREDSFLAASVLTTRLKMPV